MKKTVTLYDFLDDESLKDNFSYHGRIALFEHLEDMEEQSGYEMEYDPVAIRCDFTEYANLEEIQSYYPKIESIDDLYDNTYVIEFEGGIIIQNF